MALTDLLQTTPMGLLQTFVLPFIVIFAIFFGILTAMKKFNKKINLVLALALTIAAGYGGAFEFLSTYLLQLGAYAAIIAFAALFFIGIFIWTFGKGKEIYLTSLRPEERVKKIREKIEKLYDELDKTYDEGKRIAIIETIKRLKVEEEIAARELHRR